MVLPKKIAPIFVFLFAVNVLIGMGPVWVYAGEKSIWTNKETWKKASEQIVRLPPSAFPQLSEQIQKDLSKRGCSIPQPVMTGSTLPPDYKGNNVLSGKFKNRIRPIGWFSAL